MPKPPYTKPAFTIGQQIDQLRKRGMVINDHPLAEHYLSQINTIGWKTRAIWR